MNCHLTVLSLLAIISSDGVRDTLERNSEFWFVCLLISSAGVAVGCLLEIGETWSDFWKWLAARKDPDANKEDKSWHKPLAAIGLLLVIIGVVGEGVFEAKVSNSDTALRAHDEQVLGDTIIQAGEAEDSAEKAASASARAEGSAGSATKASASAIKVATGARKEADLYAREIANAKQQSADASSKAAAAVSRLAGAEQRLADATQREVHAETELKLLKTPRSLIETDKLVAALKPFPGTGYMLEVAQDDESIQFTKNIGKLLNSVGWIRKEPEGHNLGMMYFNVFGSDPKDAVPVCIGTGIEVSLKTSESLESLQSRPTKFLPHELQVAIALRLALSTSISPPNESNVADKVSVDTDPKLGPITICVGNKP